MFFFSHRSVRFPDLLLVIYLANAIKEAAVTIRTVRTVGVTADLTAGKRTGRTLETCYAGVAITSAGLITG